MTPEHEDTKTRLIKMLAGRLHSIVAMDDPDYRLLNELKPVYRTFRRNRVICHQGDEKHNLAFLEHGLAFSYRYMAGGGRHIIDLHFPGDFIGLAELGSPNSDTGVAALSDSCVVYVSQESAREMQESPRIGRALFKLLARQQHFLTERFLYVARLTATQRVAHLLLEARERSLSAMSDAPSSYCGITMRFSAPTSSACSIRLPQSVLADILGLSFVHVNRTLRYLRESGLVDTSNRNIELIDIPGLQRAASGSLDLLDVHLPKSTGQSSNA